MKPDQNKSDERLNALLSHSRTIEPSTQLRDKILLDARHHLGTATPSQPQNTPISRVQTFFRGIAKNVSELSRAHPSFAISTALIVTLFAGILSSRLILPDELFLTAEVPDEQELITLALLTETDSLELP